MQYGNRAWDFFVSVSIWLQQGVKLLYSIMKSLHHFYPHLTPFPQKLSASQLRVISPSKQDEFFYTFSMCLIEVCNSCLLFACPGNLLLNSKGNTGVGDQILFITIKVRRAFCLCICVKHCIQSMKLNTHLHLIWHLPTMNMKVFCPIRRKYDHKAIIYKTWK